MAQSKAVAKQNETFLGLNPAQITKAMEEYIPLMAQVLPQYVRPERVLQVGIQAMTRNPKIQECTRETIVGAIMQSCILDLDPTPELGQCYFIPYFNSKTGRHELQFQRGYKGTVNLARRSGEISEVKAVCVYEKDFFRHAQGTGPFIEHIENLDGDRGPLKYVYARIRYKDGGVEFEIMNKERVYHIRNKSQSYRNNHKSSPWTTDEQEMWKKTALNQVLKTAPLSTQNMKMIAVDNAVIPVTAFNPATKELDTDKVKYDWEDDTPQLSPSKPAPVPPAEPPANGDAKSGTAIHEEPPPSIAEPPVSEYAASKAKLMSQKNILDGHLGYAAKKHAWADESTPEGQEQRLVYLATIIGKELQNDLENIIRAAKIGEPEALAILSEVGNVEYPWELTKPKLNAVINEIKNRKQK